MIFPCERCGLCCKHIEKIPELKDLDSGDGRCIHLQDNNLCAIYESRPDICRVDRMYELVFVKQMSEDEYISINIEGCNALKRQYVL
ncbi:MAG: YkgJ family cysteine cluster protein [Lachnospiraceae bacterium]|nr:YkgJ family cysteine cluster protein [Lachnospiraceae bacterium]